MTSYFLSHFFLLCYSSQTSCERALSISLEQSFSIVCELDKWRWGFEIWSPFVFHNLLKGPNWTFQLWWNSFEESQRSYSVVNTQLKNCLYVRWGLCSQFEHLETGSILIEPLKRFMIVLPGLMWSSHTEKFPERQFGRPPKISLIIRRADILSR